MEIIDQNTREKAAEIQASAEHLNNLITKFCQDDKRNSIVISQTDVQTISSQYPIPGIRVRCYCQITD